MHYFLYLKVVGLYVQKLQTDTSVGNRLLVVHDKKTVLECVHEAESRGIQEGTPLPEAKSILREQGKFIEVNFEDFEQEKKEWLDVCLSFTNSIEAESPASAWLDLSPHADPDFVADQLLRTLLQQTRYRVSVGASPTKWVAKVIARSFGQIPLEGISLLDCEKDAFKAIHQLPTSMLLPVEPEIRARLAQLGYRRIGHVAQAPLSALSRQFGKRGILVHRAAHGLSLEPLHSNYPESSFSHSVRFEAPIDSQLILEQALDSCARACAAELCQQDKVAQTLHLTFETESGFDSWTRTFSKPTQKATVLTTALRQGLGSVELVDGVMGIRVLLYGLKNSLRSQMKLGNEHESELKLVRAQSSIQRLNNAFGHSKLVKATDLEWPRRKKLLQLWKQSTGWSP
ncbi:hypothetical protein QPK87_27935 [Kamptonema cortianum]|nr:hypothetical protein [Geitlerinema splendidum]MDK3160358.1 hypothetical protein [Kamptonema cortianum]